MGEREHNTVLDATHCWGGQLYKQVEGASPNGKPLFVRWIKCRAGWANVPRAYAITDGERLHDDD